jgi:phospholipase C
MKHCIKVVICLIATLSTAAFATVTVSSPTSGATVSSPVSYVATASTTTCAKGVASMGIYVSNKLVYVVDAAKMNTTLSLGAGAQHTVVEEWDHCGGATYTTLNITVQASTAPTASISANPNSITSGGSSTLTVAATNATQVTVPERMAARTPCRRAAELW